ncbi:MAG: ABC transporter permease [Bacilli bacterium]|nr:ABC transporter permease [Bacilli bacterium]
MITGFIILSISMAVVYLFGCTGEIIIEKGGNLNLGIPGIMSLGALGGVIGSRVYFSLFGAAEESVIGFVLLLMIILFTILFAVMGGLIYAVLTVTFQANQNVTGLVLTMFGVGFMRFVGTKVGNDNLTLASRNVSALFPNASNIGWFGEIFLSYSFLTYLAIVLAILTGLFLNKTRKGLFLRAIGESPQTADSQGVNVIAYKYLAIIVGSAIAGLGGAYYVFNVSGGTTFVEATIEAFGWLAVALVIFSMWKPVIGIIGSIIFGALSILPIYLNIPVIQKKLFAILPYLMTVIVLVVTSILDAKNSQPPKSLGVNYYREDR